MEYERSLLVRGDHGGAYICAGSLKKRPKVRTLTIPQVQPTISSVLRGDLRCSMEQGGIRAEESGSVVPMLQRGGRDRISCGGSVSGMLNDPTTIGPSGSRLT